MENLFVFNTFSQHLIQQTFNQQESETQSRSQSNEVKSEADSFDDRFEAELKNKQIKVLQETIRNLQRKLIETSTKEKQYETRMSELEDTIRESNVKELLLRTKIANKRTSSQSGPSVVNDDASETSSTVLISQAELGGHEPQVVSFATAFLVIHPKGIELEHLLRYVQQFVPTLCESELHDVLTKNEILFCTTNEGSKWLYCGFSNKLP